MIGEIGQFALILALILAVVQGSLPLVGAARNSAPLMGLASSAAIGQFAFIALAFGATKWCEDRPWFGPWVRRPVCLLIALAGVVWMVERLMQ